MKRKKPPDPAGSPNMLVTRLTSSPYFYTFLYIAICLFLITNILEIVFLLVHKRRRERTEANKELLKHRIAAAIITEKEPCEALPKPVTYLEHEAYSETAASIIESFEGEIAERASRLILELGIDLYYKRLSRNQVWFKRAHAIDILSAMRLKTNREFFSAVFRSESSTPVKYRIIYGLSLLIRGREDIYSLSKMLSSLPYLTAKYTEDIFFNVITALKAADSEGEFGLFLKQIMTDPAILTKVKRDCVSACHSANCERAGIIIREYYTAFKDEPEVATACIKTLVRMGDFDILPEALRHKDWRVRLTALKYVHLCTPVISPDAKPLLHAPSCHSAVLPGILRQKDWQLRLADLKHAHICKPEILQELRALLHDPNYHIRINAAQALSRLGAPGIALLKEGAASPDKFAADAARYALDSAETSS